MKIIDLVLQKAFRLMREKEDSSAHMARKLGISGAHMTRILKGKTNYLSDETWTRIEPIITPYIRTDTPAAPPAPSIPPEVIREVMASACSAADKAIILRDLLSPHEEHPRREITLPPGQDSVHLIHWHDVVACPKCGEEVVIPEGVTKFACPECGQRMAFGKVLQPPELVARNEAKNGKNQA